MSFSKIEVADIHVRCNNNLIVKVNIKHKLNRLRFIGSGSMPLSTSKVFIMMVSINERRN